MAILGYPSHVKASMALSLYRQLLREARSFPARPVGRKVAFNVREMYELHRADAGPLRLAELRGDAEAALRVVRWLKALPKVGFWAENKNCSVVSYF